MIGTWRGYYKFNSERFQKATGFDKTNFTIEISFFDGYNFKGIVNDDTDSGGMKGTGEIAGTVKNYEISFVKQMPVYSLLYPSGKRKDLNRKHPKLYYTGKLLNSQTEASGTWKFKMQLLFLFGIIPFPSIPGGGTWSMKLEKTPTRY